MSAYAGGLVPGFLQSQGIGTDFFNTLFGKPDEFKQLPTKNAEQNKGLSQIFSSLNQMGGKEGSFGRAENYLSSILKGGQEGFDQFSQPYLQQFEQQILPRISERFAGLGGGMGGGVGSSSGFGQALGGAGSDLSAKLAQLYSGLQQGAAGQASQNYGNLASLGLGTNPFENVYLKGDTGIFGGLASGLSQGAGQAGGMQAMMKLLPYLGGIVKKKSKKSSKKKIVRDVNIKRNRKESKQQRYNATAFGIGVG